MHALTIKNPWAWAIAHGPKRIENRGWSPPPEFIGKLIAIHAGKSVDDQQGIHICRRLLYQSGIVMPDDALLMPGAVVAVARLAGVVSSSTDPWFAGPKGWILEEVTAITPIQTRGMQGLWQLSPPVETEVLRRLANAQAQASGR